MSKLYRIHTDTKTLQNVKEINFADHDFKERYDIQEWVESTPQILEEDLLIIAKEKTVFDGTKERPDLIALDNLGNIVIIELKRDDSGSDVHWQAIKYASYWSKFEIDNIISVYKDYLEHKDNKEYSEEIIQDRILDFLDEDGFENINNRQRIILTSHQFSREVVSASKWLIDEYNMDLKCVELIPYYDKDLEVYNITSNTLLPLSGLEDYIVKPLDKKDYNNQSKGSVRKNDEITFFLEDINEKLHNSDGIKEKPSKNSRWAGVTDTFRYYHFWYKKDYWGNWVISYRIWKYNEKAKDKANQFCLYLTLNKRELLADGMSETEFNRIIDYLENVDIDGFEFEIEKDNYSLRKVYPSDDLTEVMKRNILKDLIILINRTKSKIDDIKK